MSEVWVRASIEDVYIKAELEVWVELDVWRTACDECSVQVHVTRVLSLRVKVVGGGWFSERAELSWRAGRLTERAAADGLREKWLEDCEDWRPYILRSELREIDPPGPPPGAAPLFEEAGGE